MSEFDRSQYMTTGQAARYLGVSAETVRRWCTSGTIESVTTGGGRHLVHRDAVAERRPRPTARDED